MARLAVNVDHVATVRQARGINEPDPILAAGLAELAGADGIICHLREDRRHINDRDVRLLRQTVKTKLNLEMAAEDEIIAFAQEMRPDLVTFVPEKREELTTEGGLDVKARPKHYEPVVSRMKTHGILVSFFVDPEPDQVKAAHDCGADIVEIHTGHYAEAKSEADRENRFQYIVRAVHSAEKIGLAVSAGHGLNYFNIKRFSSLPQIEEYSIGHSIISRAILVGIEKAVQEMIALVEHF
jgi:pyridoxine 5-phosphate synthase